MIINPLLHELFQLLSYLISVVLDREHHTVEAKNWKFVDDGEYYGHLSINSHLLYIAHVGPGMLTGHGRASFLGRRLVDGHFGLFYLLF